MIPARPARSPVGMELQRGERMLARNRPGMALSCFEKACELAPGSFAASGRALGALEGAGRLAAAVKLLSSAHCLAPYERGISIMKHFALARAREPDAAAEKSGRYFQRMLRAVRQAGTPERRALHFFCCRLHPRYPWREKSLFYSGEDEIRRWVTWHGREILDQAMASGRGAILLTAHFCLVRVPTVLLERKGYRVAYLQAGYDRLLRFGIGRDDSREIVDIPFGGGFNLASLQMARRALASGRLLVFAGDGLQGNANTPVEFLNGRYLARNGFAELALLARVPVIPCFCATDLDGHITIDVYPPLQPDTAATTHRHKVTSLVQQFVTLLGAVFARYPENYSSRHFPPLEPARE